MFTPIGTLIKTLPRRSKTPEAIVALHVRLAFRKALSKVFADLPTEFLVKVKPRNFKNGTLTIGAPTLTATELSMRSERLKKEINEALEKKLVERLRFRVS
ncbi:MAG: DciA family protein [Patescibacteria group bacterium]